MSTRNQALENSSLAFPQDAQIRDYIALLKPRVMSLVVFTGFIGLLLAPGTIHPLIATIAVACIALGSGAAGAINMWYERDVDALMKRTRHRPLPAGRLTPEHALEFAIVCSFASVFLMATMVNYAAALLLLGAILFYVFIYTVWLKRRTPQNIVIGGAAGAFPPMIGWAAVTGNVTLEPLVLFAIIFMWTPPHFWSLALYRCEDYSKAGIPMLPVVAGKDATRVQILLYTLLLIPVVLAPFAIGMSGPLYLMSAALLHGMFILHALRVYHDPSERFARPMFRYSIHYLFLLFSALIIDHIVLS